MRSIGIAAAVLLVIGAVAVAGCGGSDDTSSTATAISKDDFIAQADQICAAGNKADAAASKEAFSGGQPTEAEVASYVTDSVVPSIQGQIDDIRALGAPEGDEAEVNSFLDTAQEALDQVEADPSAITTSGEDPFDQTNRLMTVYGITECANG
jgi:hypothetical protein